MQVEAQIVPVGESTFDFISKDSSTEKWDRIQHLNKRQAAEAMDLFSATMRVMGYCVSKDTQYPLGGSHTTFVRDECKNLSDL